MDLNQLLETDLQPLSRISPSRFVELEECALRGIFAASKTPALLPGSPDARLGSIIHRMFELASKEAITSEDCFNEKWNEYLKQEENKMVSGLLEKNLVPLERHAKSFEVKKNLCLQKIKQLFPTRLLASPIEISLRTTSTPVVSRGSELWFETADKKIGGIIDNIRRVSDGVEIIDYKSGDLFEKAPDGSQQIKKVYQIQLKIYAALYYLKIGKWPAALKLTGLSQQSVDVSFTPEECSLLIEQAKQKFEEINNLIARKGSWEDLANPSPKTCRFCGFRPACKKYINHRKDEDGWALDAAGKIKEKKIFQNGYRIVLETSTGKLNIRGLKKQSHPALGEEVENVMLFNLRKDTSAGNFIAGDFTVSFATPFSFL